MQINLHSVPALISLVLMAMLAFINWLERRERLNTALALFTSLLTLFSLMGFLGLATDAPARGRLWFRLMILLATPTYWAGFYYVLVLTGFDQRMDQRLLGLRLRHMAIAAVGITTLVQILAQTTTLLVDLDAPTLEMTLSPLSVGIALAMAPLGLYLMATFFMILLRAWQATEQRSSERLFVLLNIIGVACVFWAGALGAKVLALLGMDWRPWTFASYTVASMLFYVAKVRYQRDQIEAQVEQISELIRSLEQKVEQRTRHLREAQAQLAQAEKMASLGRLAAGVAHEVNNPLGALRSTNATSGRWRARLTAAVEGLDGSRPEAARDNVALALEQLEQGERIIEQGASRVGETVDRLRAFARLDQADLQVVDLHDCIEDTLALEHALQGAGLTVHRDYDTTLPRVTCYPAQLNQVLENLLSNAVDAMDGGGDLWIRTAAEEGQALVSIRDSGSGIPHDLLARVFDPGFTTKSRGVGTGLGLAICYQVMRDHCGSVEITSEPGQGTTATLRLPLESTLA